MKLRHSAPLLLTLALAATAATAQAQDGAAATPTTDVAAAPAEASAPAEAAAPADAAAPAEAAAPADAAVPAEVAAPADAAAPATDAVPTSEATPAADAAVAAPGAFSAKVAAAIGAPADGQGLVVFFRPSKFTGAAIGFKVREAGVELGKLGNGSFFALPVAPGAHSYVVHSEAKDVTNLEVEAGETYFLAGSISMGFMAGHPNLSPSDAAAFEAALHKLKKTQPLN